MKQQGAKKEVNLDLSLHPQVVGAVLCQVVDPPDQDQAAHLPVLIQIHQVQTLTHLMINTKTKRKTRINMTTIRINIMTTRIDIMIMINTGKILTFDGYHCLYYA